jgi:uncharacterized protein (DUF1697 family)
MTSKLNVALLRGINVGSAKRIAMGDLRALVEALGYGEVRTLLNSGNVVFSSTGAPKGDPAQRIGQALAAKLGVSARVTVLTAAGLEAIVHQNPLLERMTDPSRMLVAVLQDPGDRIRLQPLLEQDWGEDALAPGPGAAYLWCTAGVLASPLSVASARALRDHATTRNWSTILKLHRMLLGTA